MTIFLLSILFLQVIPSKAIHAQTANTNELPRRADWQAVIQSPDGSRPGAVVQSVTEGSPLDEAGLKKGDRIIEINGELIMDPNRWSDIKYQARAGKPIDLLIKRNGEPLNINVSLNELPRERFEGIESSFEVVVSDYGHKLRAIVTRPENSSGKLPGIFVVQGLSCNSIEVHPGRSVAGWTRLLKEMVTNSGMAVMRIEKPGVGDSQGACSETDLKTEMAAYRAGLEHFSNHEWVDDSRIVIFGSSAGSSLIPVFANEFDVSGIIATGTFVKTWFEHMLEIERRIRSFEGVSPAGLSLMMNEGYIPLYYGMLIDKKSYGEVIEDRPDLADYNYHSDRHMYGRPVEYYHQLQDLNIAGAWAELEVPARIRWGTNDWIMSEEDNDMIIDILEKNGHEDHKFVKFPGLDHFNMIRETPKDSYENKPGSWDPAISQQVIDWALEMANNLK